MKEKFDFPLYNEYTGNNMMTAIYIKHYMDDNSDNNSIDIQYSALKQYCVDCKKDNPAIFIDDNCTGSQNNYPAYQQMLELMKKGKVNFIIIYSLDRISKSQKQILNFLNDIKKYKCNFYTLKEEFDSRDKEVFDLILSTITTFAMLD